MTATFSYRAMAGLACFTLLVLSNCTPSEVAPPPRDAATADATADVPRDLPPSQGDAVSEATADASRGGPCGNGGVCGGGQRCDPARMQCVDCLATAHCGGATPVCASGRCVAATPCNSSRMCPGQVCDLNQSRCVDCVADAECETGQRCTDGVCGMPATCRSSRDCSAAGLVCNVTQMRCVECLEDRDCAMGSTCTAGNVCRVAACTANARRCVSTTRVAVCDARGGMETETDCASGEVCVGGECRRLLCAPGSVSCESASARRTCNADGMAFTVTACTAGESCVGGECRRPGCTPGAASCTSSTERRVCNADGMTFSTMTCPSGQTCSGGTCAGTTCPTGRALCGGACVDLLRDAAHCGMCGRACPAGAPCSEGNCAATLVAPAPMTVARLGHALVSLPDGRVVAIGGQDERFMPMRSVEIYDPATNRWQAGAPSPSAFQIAYGALLRDGRVAVSGNSGIVEVYTPATNTWSSLPRLASAGTTGFAVTHELEGQLYAIDLNSLTAYSYNLMAGTWRTLATLPGGNSANGARVAMDVRGRVHLMGDSASRTLYAIYSPSNNTWATGPALSDWRSSAAVAMGPDGRLIACGGLRTGSGIATYFRDARAYDLMSGTFATLTPMSVLRTTAAAALIPGGILVTGGAWREGDTYHFHNSAEIYTFATNTWR